ncbi:MAG: S1 family peptidase [Propionibacteriaceae bacterium]|nr:S1 family peptidase [Propionibacteriaceae bacterium]
MIGPRRRLALGVLLSSAAMLAGQPVAIANPGPVESWHPQAQPVRQEFTEEQVRAMAQSAGRTEDGQRRHLQHKAEQNNVYAELARTHEFDGAFFTADGTLVVQAPAGSAAGTQAERAGLQVRAPRFGEAYLNRVTEQLSGELAGRGSVLSVAPDLAADIVVVTVTAGAVSEIARMVAVHGGAVAVRPGERNATQGRLAGGDQLRSDTGGACSAGFPARTADGRAVMVWVGHCIEGATTFTARTGVVFGTFGATGVTSYDGQADRDFGYIFVSEGNEMTPRVNGYGGAVSQADRGAWKAPVGTDLCKSGAASGITCGQVTAYNATVRYGGAATVTGLGVSSVCTAPGDSGGAYVSGGYAVGMTSGGPAGQRCPFNGGVVSGAVSYFQPVTDALEHYGLRYGR